MTTPEKHRECARNVVETLVSRVNSELQKHISATVDMNSALMESQVVIEEDICREIILRCQKAASVKVAPTVITQIADALRFESALISRFSRAMQVTANVFNAVGSHNSYHV